MKISIYFEIDTQAVLQRRPEEQNGIFCRLKPGLVGGHCIGVDPLFSSKSSRKGYHPEIILIGRRLNDSMGRICLPDKVV